MGMDKTQRRIWTKVRKGLKNWDESRPDCEKWTGEPGERYDYAEFRKGARKIQIQDNGKILLYINKPPVSGKEL